MTCRCSSAAEHASRAAQFEASSHRTIVQSKDAEIKALKTELASLSPTANDYEILDVVSVGSQGIVLKVKYPCCACRDYEGMKVLVYFNSTINDVVFWKQIDPHFRNNEKKSPKHKAPGPDARFPATDDGWNNALRFLNASPANNQKGAV